MVKCSNKKQESKSLSALEATPMANASHRSTESAASILEAIQIRILQEEETAWNLMELSFQEEDGHEHCRAI